LVIDANFKQSLFLPSKLVESFAYNVPVLGITPKDSESERVLNTTNNLVVNYDSLDKLFLIIPELFNRQPSLKEISSSVEEYRSKSQGLRWYQLISSIKVIRPF
jgi:hypothetical protein